MSNKISEKKTIESDEQLDARLDKMKRLPRGSFKTKNSATDLKNCKVKISIMLDADILDFFKSRASEPNAAPYQTQINNELRRVMENTNENEVVTVKMMENRAFLSNLAAKLKEFA